MIFPPLYFPPVVCCSILCVYLFPLIVTFILVIWTGLWLNKFESEFDSQAGWSWEYRRAQHRDDWDIQNLGQGILGAVGAESILFTVQIVMVGRAKGAGTEARIAKRPRLMMCFSTPSSCLGLFLRSVCLMGFLAASRHCWKQNVGQGGPCLVWPTRKVLLHRNLGSNSYTWSIIRT